MIWQDYTYLLNWLHLFTTSMRRLRRNALRYYSLTAAFTYVSIASCFFIICAGYELNTHTVMLTWLFALTRIIYRILYRSLALLATISHISRFRYIHSQMPHCTISYIYLATNIYCFNAHYSSWLFTHSQVTSTTLLILIRPIGSITFLGMIKDYSKMTFKCEKWGIIITNIFLMRHTRQRPPL